MPNQHRIWLIVLVFSAVLGLGGTDEKEQAALNRGLCSKFKKGYNVVTNEIIEISYAVLIAWTWLQLQNKILKEKLQLLAAVLKTKQMQQQCAAFAISTLL